MRTIPSNAGEHADDLATLADPRRTDAALARLIAAAEPLVTRIVNRRRGFLRADDLEDMRAETLLRLTRHLRGGNAGAIEDFEAYVAGTTFRAIDDHARTRHPERTRLANRIRYAASHDPRFAMWTWEGEIALGFAASHGGEPRPLAADFGPLDPTKVADSISRLLARNGAPLLLHEAVDALACAAGLDRRETLRESVAEPLVRAHAGEGAELALTAAALWREIAGLPPRQRVALLLHMRDERGDTSIALLLQGGIPADAIAGAVGLSRAELVARWDDLPYDDNTIAAMLGARRQQVINLRKCARERLARRLRGW